MNQKTKDALVLGFALFAVFFGAGNLIFPPLIGVVSGSAYEGRRGIPVAGRTGGDAGAAPSGPRWTPALPGFLPTPSCRATALPSCCPASSALWQVR